MFPFPFVLSVSATPSLTWRDADWQTTSGATFTTKSIAIGTADSSRLVFALVSTYASNTATTDSVSIGGVSASKLFDYRGTSGTDHRITIWVATVPTGTTATVSITASTSVSQIRCGVYTGFNIDVSSVYASASGENDPQTLNCNTLQNAVVIGISANRNDSTETWTGLTKDYQIPSGNSGSCSYASAIETAAQTPRSISVAFSGTNAPVAGAIVLRAA